MYHKDNTCRICLQIKDTLFSLYRKREGTSPFDKLVNKTKLMIELNDAGPSSICSQCLIELDTTVNFLEKCERSNQVLAEILATCTQGVDEECLIIKNVQSEIEVSEDGLSGLLQEENVGSVEEVRAKECLDQKDQCSECGSKRRCRHWAPLAIHTCQYCQKVFKRKFNFQLHLKRHLGERDWPCPTCGVAQLTHSLAARHCEPRIRRPCPVPGCGKTFTTNTNLNTHIRTHSGERPFECGVCGKRFTSKNTLNDHVRIHTGVKPYICSVCGKRFTTNKLSAHMRTHARARGVGGAGRGAGRGAGGAGGTSRGGGGGRVSCALCGARYSHKQSLNKHLRKHHAQKPPCHRDEATDTTKDIQCEL